MNSKIEDLARIMAQNCDWFKETPQDHLHNADLFKLAELLERYGWKHESERFASIKHHGSGSLTVTENELRWVKTK